MRSDRAAGGFLVARRDELLGMTKSIPAAVGQ